MKNRIIIYLVTFFSIGLGTKGNAELGGDLLQAIFPIVSIGLTASNNDVDGRQMFYKGSALTICSTYLLKISINKKRPNGGGWSFPSGHTSWAFSNAAFIHKRYGNRFGLPAFILASFVGWSRVESKNHYWNDVYNFQLKRIKHAFRLLIVFLRLYICSTKKLIYQMMLRIY